MSDPNPIKLPPGQQLVAAGKWPVIGERKPADSSQPWQLTLSGAITKPKTFTIDQLQSLHQTTSVIDIHCVTRWSKLGVEFKGVLLAEILKAVELETEPAPKYVSFISRSERKHSTSLALETAIGLNTLIALEVDGAPLDAGHGGPIRNIVPGRYFYKSVKWLEQIELLTEDRLGYWEAETGYHNRADPWQEQRYMASTLDRRAAMKLIESRNFSELDLRGLDAQNRELTGLKASNAALRNANFDRSELRDADFSNANLSNAYFRFADLRGSNFVNADLEGADLSGADLRGADFTNCSLIGCSFFDPDKTPASHAVFDKATTLPAQVIEPLFPVQLAFVQNALASVES